MSDPIRIVAVRYQCPHCRRGRSSKAATIAHIDRCWRNPATRSCKTCAHHIVVYGEPEVGLPGFERCGADGRDLDPITSPVVKCPLWAQKES